MKEKQNIEIINYDDKFNEIPFKKDTLLAMQGINSFSAKNNINANDSLELFSEYIGPPIIYSNRSF